MVKEASLKKKTELNKHVNAIHCTNNLTLVQRKLFNALLFKAYPTLLQQSKFTIQTKELCQLIGYSSNDHAFLKKALLGLMNRVIEWNIISATTVKEDVWKASAILSSAEIKGGICTYEYSSTMKELLFHPKQYGKIDIALIGRFKSNYGLALYENCIRYKGISETPWFSLDIFRKLMGVKKDQYTKFSDLKKRVLDTAVKEVNSISPIEIIPKIERMNQKVTKLKFKIKQLKQLEKIAIDVDSQKTLHVLVNVFSLSKDVSESIIAKYGENFIKEKLEIIKNLPTFQSGKIKNLPGFFITMLENDYQPAKSSKKLITEQKEAKERKEKKIEKEKELVRKRYSKYINDKLNLYFETLSQEEYKEIIYFFEKHISEKQYLVKKWYDLHQLEHPAVRASFNEFVIKIKAIELGEILSISDFKRLILKS